MTLDEEIRCVERELLHAYRAAGEKNAFGDPEIVRILRRLNARLSLIEKTDPCAACNGKGGDEHDCDCTFCEIEKEECEECDGTGRVEREQENNAR